MDEIKKKLDDEIESGLNTLSTMSADDDRYRDAADNVAILYKLRLEERKLDEEFAEKQARREMEDSYNQLDYNLKVEQAENEQQNRITESCHKANDLKWQKVACFVGAGVTLTTFVIGLIFESHWYHTGFKFEETGAYVGQTFKWFRDNHRPRRK